MKPTSSASERLEDRDRVSQIGGRFLFSIGTRLDHQWPDDASSSVSAPKVQLQVMVARIISSRALGIPTRTQAWRRALRNNERAVWSVGNAHGEGIQLHKV